MTISVIVPAYNIERFIENCINSLIDQSYPEIQIICIDDGSVDLTPVVLDSFSNRFSNITVIHKQNMGVTRARIDGIHLASGDYIGFCDGDDIIEPIMYERLINNLKEYHVDISHCGHKVVYVDGREKDFYNTGCLAKQDRTEGLKALLSGSFEPGLCSKLYSKTLLHSLIHNGKMDNGIQYNEDLLMNYYLFREAESSVYEDICLYNYLKREGSACETSMKPYHIQDPLKVWEIIERECRGSDVEDLAKRMKMSRFLNIYNNLLFADNPYFEDEKKVIKAVITDWDEERQYLDIKRKIMVWMIKYVPYLYYPIFMIYRKAEEKKK